MDFNLFLLNGEAYRGVSDGGASGIDSADLMALQFAVFDVRDLHLCLEKPQLQRFVRVDGDHYSFSFPFFDKYVMTTADAL